MTMVGESTEVESLRIRAFMFLLEVTLFTEGRNEYFFLVKSRFYITSGLFLFPMITLFFRFFLFRIFLLVTITRLLDFLLFEISRMFFSIRLEFTLVRMHPRATSERKGTKLGMTTILDCKEYKVAESNVI